MKDQLPTFRVFACSLFILCIAGKCQDPPDDGVLLVGIESLSVEGTELEGLEEIRIDVQEVRVVHRTDPDDHSTEKLITVDAEQHELVFPLEEGVPTEVARFYVPEGYVYQLRIIGTEAEITLGGADHGVQIPSGAQSGLKVAPIDEVPFPIVANEYTTILINFDPDDRIVHNRGVGYKLKPVLWAELSDFEQWVGHVVDQLIVKLKTSSTLPDLEAFCLDNDITILEDSDVPQYYLLKMPTSLSMEEGVRVCHDNDIFDVILPNISISPALIPIEGADTYQEAINLPAAWDHTTGATDVRIGIPDLCFNLDIPDLIDNFAINHFEVPDTVLTNIGNYNGDFTTDWRDLDKNGDDVIRFSELTELVGEGYNVCEVSRNPNPEFPSDVCDPLDLVALGVDTLWEDGVDASGDGNGKIDDIVGWNYRDGNNVPDCVANGMEYRDVNLHGTFMMQVAAAVGNNDISGIPSGVSGTLWEASVVPVMTKGLLKERMEGIHYYKISNPSVDIIMATGQYAFYKGDVAVNPPDCVDVRKTDIDKFNRWKDENEKFTNDHVGRSDELVPYVYVLPAGNCGIDYNNENVFARAKVQRPWAITITGTEWSQWVVTPISDPVVRDTLAYGDNYVHAAISTLVLDRCVGTPCSLGSPSTSLASTELAGMIGLLIAYDPLLKGDPVAIIDRLLRNADPIMIDGKVAGNRYIDIEDALLDSGP